MIIAIDEAIPYLQSALAPLGKVRTFLGRSVRAVEVRDAQVLIVRSVTRVDSALLEGSAVQFVGTVTIGTDHLDLEYLDRHKICVANAAGCNAMAVSEWVVAALLEFAARSGWELSDKLIGIVGVGHIGSLVEKKASALGMQVLLCDPPLRESTGDTRFGFLDDVLDADILTLHVPLATQGPYPTYHMIDERVLKRLSRRQLLVNSSRGPVVNGLGLKSALSQHRIAGALLDVWEGEPSIDAELLALSDLGTCHIAGWSLDGKVRGTAMIYEALRNFLGIKAEWDASGLLPSSRSLRFPSVVRGQEAIRLIVRDAYDIMKDDAALRSLPKAQSGMVVQGFDRLRDGYPFRPEFSHFQVEVPRDSGLEMPLTSLGFQMTPPAAATSRR